MVKDHECHNCIDFDEMEVNDFHNERIEAETPCEKCGKPVTMSFVLDFYRVDEETHYHP